MLGSVISRTALFDALRRSIVAALTLLLVASSTSAAPTPFLYDIGNDVQGLDSGAVYRFFYVNPFPRNVPARPRNKKYDRNCFFSPVQCMLYNNAHSTNDLIYPPNGRK
ncbi:hypothetical protein M3Y99_01985900 [Aphelenchoides fujianensis]|nr:hypothetical protein M3Y99_01985900 [Aphelenchoides fujianensis]